MIHMLASIVGQQRCFLLRVLKDLAVVCEDSVQKSQVVFTYFTETVKLMEEAD